MKTFVAAFGLALGALVHGQNLTKKIDYTGRAVTLSQACIDLSKLGGAELFVEPQLQNEIVILRLKDVTVKDAMDRIADTVGAEWQETKAGYQLERSEKLAEALHEEDIDRETERLKLFLEEQFKSYQVDVPFTDQRVDHMAQELARDQATNLEALDNITTDKLMRRAPDSRATFRVFERIDPREIAAVPDGSKVVFSDKPTKMERPIEGDLSEIAKTMFDEHNRFVSIYKKYKKPPINGQMILVTNTEPMADVPSRFVLVVRNEAEGQIYELNLFGFNAKGRAVIGTQTDLFSFQYNTFSANRAKVSKDAASEPTIPLSPLSKELMAYQKSLGGTITEQSPVVMGALREATLHPAQVEPLSLVASDAFIGLAEIKNENLVVYADDAYNFVASLGGDDQGLKPSMVLQSSPILRNFFRASFRKTTAG